MTAYADTTALEIVRDALWRSLLCWDQWRALGCTDDGFFVVEAEFRRARAALDAISERLAAPPDPAPARNFSVVRP